MVEDRVKNLHESGRILLEKFSGSFANCVVSANHSAQKLLQLIVDNFPSFRDEANYAGKKVSFYKRAQSMFVKQDSFLLQLYVLFRSTVLVADVWGLFKGKGLGQFDDIGCLTMFADYRL